MGTFMDTQLLFVTTWNKFETNKAMIFLTCWPVRTRDNRFSISATFYWLVYSEASLLSQQFLMKTAWTTVFDLITGSFRKWLNSTSQKLTLSTSVVSNGPCVGSLSSTRPAEPFDSRLRLLDPLTQAIFKRAAAGRQGWGQHMSFSTKVPWIFLPLKKGKTKKSNILYEQ